MIGTLPVRVLMEDVIETFENISPAFRNALAGELFFGDDKSNQNLKPNIQYHFSDSLPINEIAKITSDHKFHLYENFCQFLWCITYSLMVQFDWLTTNQNSHKIEVNQYDRAIKLLDAAFLLKKPNYDQRTFLELPNSEIINSVEEKEYVIATNAVFCVSMTFILLHEFAHHFYGHLDTANDSLDEYKNDERKADNFAIDTLLGETLQTNRYWNELGIIFALIGLTLLDKDLDGGPIHPSSDERLNNALNRMISDDAWGYAAMSLIIWNQKYNLGVEIPAVEGTYKELFISTVNKINS